MPKKTPNLLQNHKLKENSNAANISKAKELLGYNLAHTLEEGLQESIK
jgi:nucleoside-diphosphate-sugar epimerase